jgi:hypothetical protein
MFITRREGSIKGYRSNGGFVRRLEILVIEQIFPVHYIILKHRLWSGGALVVFITLKRYYWMAKVISNFNVGLSGAVVGRIVTV